MTFLDERVDLKTVLMVAGLLVTIGGAMIFSEIASSSNDAVTAAEITRLRDDVNELKRALEEHAKSDDFRYQKLDQEVSKNHDVLTALSPQVGYIVSSLQKIENVVHGERK